ESGRVGEWESGRVGEWESGRVGEWESGRVGISARARALPHYRLVKGKALVGASRRERLWVDV
ncbi:MAG: hypothetical protein EOP84_30795, partial [Verrucomicrobiaceae bacterium]